MITRTLEASFKAEMSHIKETVDLKKSEYKIEGKTIPDVFTQVSVEDAAKWDTDLKKEIVYWGKYVSDISNISKSYAKKQCDNVFASENIISNLYYVDKELVDGKEKEYVLDYKNDILYKIKKTVIGFKVVHSIEELNDLKQDVIVNLINTECSIVKTGTVSHFEPNLSGFVLDKTFIIYYDEDIETSISISAKEYIELGKPRVIERDGKKYEFFNYESQRWANILVENNEMKTYWVWIPRFSYNKNDVSDIKFIDLKTEPEDGYIVHSDFEDGKEGIWVSKYEPIQTANKAVAVEDFPHYLPDFTGFDTNNVYIEVYDSENQSFIEKKLSDIKDINAFAKENIWFNYEKQIWANIKVVNPETNTESWWVWIPRYAYTITSKNISIIFVDINNNSLDGTDLPSNYIVHSAFENGKKGIWVSKYEPILNEK